MKAKKTKKRAVAPAKKSQRRRKHDYHFRYLAIALIIVLAFEFFLFENTTNADWKEGFSLLDMTGQFEAVSQDLSYAFEPMVTAAVGVHEFLLAASYEAEAMLDFSDADPLLVVRDINQFYEEASVAMMDILDLSGSNTTSLGTVAGISIER